MSVNCKDISILPAQNIAYAIDPSFTILKAF